MLFEVADLGEGPRSLPPSSLFWVKNKKITEGRKTYSARKTTPPTPSPIVQHLYPQRWFRLTWSSYHLGWLRNTAVFRLTTRPEFYPSFNIMAIKDFWLPYFFCLTVQFSLVVWLGQHQKSHCCMWQKRSYQKLFLILKDRAQVCTLTNWNVWCTNSFSVSDLTDYMYKI